MATLPRPELDAGRDAIQTDFCQQHTKLLERVRGRSRGSQHHVLAGRRVEHPCRDGHPRSVAPDADENLLAAVTHLPRLDVDLRIDFISTNEAEFAQLGPEERIPAFVPASYINDTALRIKAYREVAEISTRDQFDRVRKEWRDRFGKFPPAVDNLFLLAEIKLVAAKAGITRVEVKERKLMLTKRGEFVLVGGKFPRLVATPPHLNEVLELTKKFT